MNPGGYVVVLFGGSDNDWCGLNRCPLGAVRWFNTRDEAGAYAERVPAGFEPHILLVETGNV